MTAKSSVRSLIKSSYRDMSQNSKKIADYVLNNVVAVSRSSISEVAKEVGVADSTVFQFAKSLGYKGFSEFKIALLSDQFDTQIEADEVVRSEDPTGVTIRKIFENNIKAIREAESLIDDKTYDRAVNILLKADRVCFFGLGGSGIEAEYAYHNFLRTDLICSFSTDADRQAALTSKLKENDCLFLYSRSGQTPIVLELVKIARQKKAKVIAVTNYPLSSLAKQADAALISTASHMEFDWGIMRSRITHYITDSLLIIYMQRIGKK